MLVQFVTDYQGSNNGFSAQIHHILINPICKDSLNISSGYLISPDQLIINCNWVITAPMGRTISIKFLSFEVKYVCIKFLFLYFNNN